MSSYELYFASFVAAVAASLSLTFVVRNIAIARGWARGPASSRHLHTSKIPRLGGIAIYVSFLAVTTTAFVLDRTFGSGTFSGLHALLSLVLPGTVVFASGLFDDFFNCKPITKIAAQILAGCLLWTDGYRVIKLPMLFGSSELGHVGSMSATIFWVLLITNAFNLIDGLDGLAAGSAFFSTVTVFVVSLVNHNFLAALLSVTLAGAILGFLRYNFNPASIFLGDCGSLFIGFMLGGLSLAGVQQKSSTLIAVAVPIVAFGLPIVETTISIVRRFMNGQPIFTADRGHIHHKLLELGWSQKSAVFLLYGISAVFALLSLILLSPGAAPVGLVLVIIGIGIAVGVQHLGYHEVFELTRIARRTIEQRDVIINNLAIRRGTEELWRSRSFSDVCEAIDGTFCDNEFDGFELQLHSLPSGALKGAKELTHSWVREEPHDQGPTAHLWSLVLHLTGDDARNYGTLALYRRSTSPLLVDINLITAEFQGALTQACRRLATPPQAAAARALAVTATVPSSSS